MPDGERTACGSATRRHQADGAQDGAVVIKRRIPPFPWHLSQAHLSARTGDGTAERMDKSVVAADPERGSSGQAHLSAQWQLRKQTI